MRYACLLLLLLSGCTIVPVTSDLGPCAAITNARACQEKPYVVRHDSGWDTASSQGDSSQKAGTTPR